ncbi:MAG: hypothetical protein JRM99_02830 [Nitrososphaerota archaeon]|nr:hypothetical protein [Nitrososphaerota archaeon]
MREYLLRYVPFCYTFNTRIRNKDTLLGLLATEHFTILYLVYLTVFGVSLSIEDVAQVVASVGLAYLLFYSIYEIGYFINDTFTIHFEGKPTIRTSNHGRGAVFVSTRALWSFLSLGVLVVAFQIPLARLLLLSITLVGIMLLHDLVTFRNLESRFYTFMSLRVLRYTFVSFIIVPEASGLALLVMLPALAHSLLNYASSKMGRELPLTPSSLALRYALLLPLQLILLRGTHLMILAPSVALVCAFTLLHLRKPHQTMRSVP